MTDLDAGASGLATVASEARIDLLDVERAAAMIRQCKDADTVREIRDQAKAIETYQRQRKASLDAQNDAAEIALRAERRLGEILREVIPHKGGNPQLSQASTVRLTDLGINRDQSSRFQKLASVPEPVFEQHIVSTRAKCEKLTTTGTIAAVSFAPGYEGDEWYTPSKYIEAAREVMGGIDLDPASNPVAQKRVKAARYFTKDDDGLAQPWEGRVWCNPPYSHPLGTQFANKFCDEIEAGAVTAGVFLQNASTDTAWFHRLAPHCLLCFPYRRIAFLTPDGVESRNNRYGQIFFYFGPERVRFAEVFGAFGLVMRPQRRAARGFAE